MSPKRVFIFAMAVEFVLLVCCSLKYWASWGNDAVLLPVLFAPVALGVAKLLSSRSARSWPPVAVAVLGVLGAALALAAGHHLSGAVASQTAIVQSIAFWLIIWRKSRAPGSEQ